MTQPELFNRFSEPLVPDRPLARSTDPSTSHEAARTVNLNRNRLIVLGWLRSNGPATHEQIARGVELHMTDSGARGRTNELVRAGLVEACGYGRTHTGRRCKVWRTVRKYDE